MVPIANSSPHVSRTRPASMPNCPMLSRAEERELAGLIANGGREARNRLAEANGGLVVKIAREFRGRGLELEDLIGEGNLGLIRAASLFDPTFGTRFSTYASYWIKEKIRAALNDTLNLVRLPNHVCRLLISWRRAESILLQEWDRKPMFDEVAAFLNLSQLQKSLVARAHAARKTKLLGSFDGESGHHSADEIRVPETSSEDLVESEDEWVAIRRRMKRLDAREQFVLARRYGLDGGERLTHQEIGRQCGTSRQRVRTIELRAIVKLRADRT